MKEKAKDDTKVVVKKKDNTKVERTVFIICAVVFVVVGLFTLFYDVSLNAFFVVAIVETVMFAVWYVYNDRL